MARIIEATKYPVALYIGRFEPLHKGHIWEVARALEKAEKVIVGIGSSNVIDQDNPWSADKRREWWQGLRNPGIEKIVNIPDTERDAEWVNLVINLVHTLGYQNLAEVLVVGNNEWVTGLLAQAFFPTYEPGFFERQDYEGTKIRQRIRTGDQSWQSLVPAHVANDVSQVGIQIPTTDTISL